MNRILILIFTFFCVNILNAQDQLRFKNGKFRIVQFTDLHWTPKSDRCNITEATINYVLTHEKPDVAVLTGDVVTDSPAIEGWHEIVSIFNAHKQLFVVTLGNHDAEYMSKDSIFDILQKSPYYIGNKGPEDVFGAGNCALPVYSSNGSKAEAVLYCIDSNDYPLNKKLGAYDKIHNSQINWYRKTSDNFTKLNGGKPLPSLAFFHIPLVETKHLWGKSTTFGNNLEHAVSSSDINSGFFASVIDKKDVMGIFAGHDHDNDYIGLEYGVAIGYGRVTGIDAYGHLERGARVIELYEGQPKFDTYIITPKGKEACYYYPSGLNSVEENSMRYLPASDITPHEKGLNYKYYEGKIKSVKQIDSCKLMDKGVLPNFTIKNAPAEDHFAYIFEGYVYIDAKGIYKFYTYSDDGSQLYIDDTLVVDNDGGHSARRMIGKVALNKGFHRIKLLYFEDYMGECLEVGYSGKDVFEQVIPDNILFRK